MGKKSKRSRGGGGGEGGRGGASAPRQPPKRSDASPTLIDDVVPPPKRAAAPGGGLASAAASAQVEEETADNLRFEDPYEDEFEEEIMDDDVDDDGGDYDADAEEVGTKGRGGATDAADEPVRSWNPLTSTLEPGTRLEIDESAYKMHHALTPEWPALSFDFIRDGLGEGRTRFPHSAIVAVGSQADRPDRNKLTVMRLSDLGRTGGKTREEEEDEILGEERSPDGGGDDDDEEDESDDEDDELADLDPVVEHYSLRHSGGINRVRVLPQCPEVVATWSDGGTVNLFDVRGILDAFERSSGGAGAGGAGGSARTKIRRDPFFVYQGHSTEGYAMDWSRVKAGQMATGDCDGNVHLWQLADGGSSLRDGGGGSWSNSSFRVSAAYGPTGGNIDCPSIEDIQWSPTESTVFATAECGGYVKVYDVRCRDRPMISNKVHASGADVNVLAWNGLVSNLLATGGDDGVLTVWDLRNFQPKSSGGGGGDPSSSVPPPLARFTAHRNPITSLEWHPTDESMIAVSDEAGAYVYDLSIEEDDPDSSRGVGGGGSSNVDGDEDGDVPPQLLFVHCGSESTKEVHWHPQVTSMMMTTALSGFSLFIPSNL